MLARLLLLILQLAIAWVATQYIAGFVDPYVPVRGDYRIFEYAVIFGIVVWVVGIVASLVLRDVGTPSGATLVSAIILALVGAALVIVPPLVGLNVWQFVPSQVAEPLRPVPREVVPLIGAVLGYIIKR
jgi:hypothetical protein